MLASVLDLCSKSVPSHHLHSHMERIIVSPGAFVNKVRIYAVHVKIFGGTKIIPFLTVKVAALTTGSHSGQKETRFPWYFLRIHPTLDVKSVFLFLLHISHNASANIQDL